LTHKSRPDYLYARNRNHKGASNLRFAAHKGEEETSSYVRRGAETGSGSGFRRGEGKGTFNDAGFFEEKAAAAVLGGNFQRVGARRKTGGDDADEF
jgi:hypothetical protein